MTQVVVLVAAAVAGPAMLLLWSLVYRAGCWSLLVPAGVVAVLTAAGRDRLLWRRHCLADCLFVEGSALHRLLRSRILVTLIAAAVATGLTAVLMAQIPSWSFEIVALLALDALLLATLYVALYRLAAGGLHVNPGRRGVLAKSGAVALNLLLVVPALLLVQLQQAPPQYLDAALRLGPTLQAASDSVASGCPLVDQLVRLGQEGEAFAWWLTLRATRAIDDAQLRWIAWLLFLASGTLSLWAYGSFCVQLIHYAQRVAGRP
jgi:hypothetical protein